MSQRNLTFDDENLTFLLLNIIGHDPIHDFGHPSSNKWEQVKNSIRQIKPYNLSVYDGESHSTGGNTHGYGVSLSNQQKVHKSVSRSFIKDKTFKIYTKEKLKPGVKPHTINVNGFNPYQIPKVPKIYNTVKANNKRKIDNDNSENDLELSSRKISPSANFFFQYDFLYDSHIINEHIEALKCNVIMVLFYNSLKYENEPKVFTSLLSICQRLFIMNDELNSMSIHFHDYIISLILPEITEKQDLTIIFDAVMSTRNNIKVRHVLVNHYDQEDSNTAIISKNISHKFNTFDINVIINAFFKSKFYFFDSFKNFSNQERKGGNGRVNGNSPIIESVVDASNQKQNKTLNRKLKQNSKIPIRKSTPNSVVPKLTPNSSTSTPNLSIPQDKSQSIVVSEDIKIKNIRKVLNFKDGVFNDIMTDNEFIDTIQKIRNAAYHYTKAGKGFPLKDEDKDFSLDELKASFFMKSDKNSSAISSIVKEKRNTIIGLYCEMFRKLEVVETKVVEVEVYLKKIPDGSRRVSRIDENIETSLSDIFKTEYAYRKKYDEKIRKDKILEDKNNLAASSGKLTDDLKETANQFISFIAKSALYLTNCCDSSGVIIIKNPNKILQEEIDCIRSVAGRADNNTSIWKTGPNKSDIDTHLFKFIRNTDLADKDRNFTEDSLKFSYKKQYVINNAANITRNFQLKSFCPYTSILDGMSQCSWKSAELNNESLESGNMNFIIRNEDKSKFYNGTMEILDKNNVKIGLNIKLNKCDIVHYEKIQMNSDSLVAHVVLRKTLDSIISYIDEARNSYKNRFLYAEKDIFQKLFEIGVNELSLEKSSHHKSIFTIFFKNILFKGIGDIFQEINAIAKYGGYTGENYNCGLDINERYFDTKKNDSNKKYDGDALRCFVAKDRVSVSRYLFIKKNGKKGEINLRTCGGYIDGFTSGINMGVSCNMDKQLGGRFIMTEDNTSPNHNRYIGVKDKPRMRSISSKPMSIDNNKTKKKRHNGVKNKMYQ